MAERLLKFVKIEPESPAKRDARARTGDFHEIYAEFITAKANEQASRCSQCGVPFCQTGCPLQNNIPDWLKMTAEGRLEEAYALSSATNSMPEICGRICPQDRLCEQACVIEQSGHGAVTIGAVERYITETAWENGWIQPIIPLKERSESVGIIGAGPAGLAAAEALRNKGYQVTIYDRYDRAGGLLIYGIPGFKLEKDVVARRVAHLDASGVKFVLNYELGRDGRLDDLRSLHDSLLIAVGVYQARALPCPGSKGAGVLEALDYLTASNKTGLGDTIDAFDDGTLNAKGKRVVVIGGGDTAMDCVRTAVRQGAAQVTCLYRRDRANMPGSAREVANAEDEGVTFEWLAAPKAIKGDHKALSSVVVSRMRLGEADASGRQAPEIIPGGEFELEADMVVKALGFDPEDVPNLFGAPGLKVSRWGTIRADAITGETSIPGVFAAGDIVRGASLVVWAIKDGREAAEHMHKMMVKQARTRANAMRVAAE
jgi:glutamate synthase (NADPH/NADH) small chain